MEKKRQKKEIEDHFSNTGRLPYPVIGRIAEPENPGEIWVVFDGNDPVPARLLSSIDRRELLKKSNVGRQVLLMFENGLKEFPIIVGLLENIIEDIISVEIAPEASSPAKPADLFVDNERIVFEAKKEIVLKCGKGSITIKRDGKVVILGTNLTSRSRGPNKIKGASVSIN
ncbi:MAG: hypothetical protein C4519_20125 [Desulfobacteraceae bacterium]|nr:MAG: hypothetical protein C4519_20125 [Desulfobacteraceae bacterium]